MTDIATGFCPEPSQDVREIRDWVHEFAASVIRPAGAEWDEREETPWPIIQETEPKLTIAPPPAACMSGKTAWAAKN